MAVCWTASLWDSEHQGRSDLSFCLVLCGTRHIHCFLGCRLWRSKKQFLSGVHFLVRSFRGVLADYPCALMTVFMVDGALCVIFLSYILEGT